VLRVYHTIIATRPGPIIFIFLMGAPLSSRWCEFEFTELFDPISESESVELGPSADGGGEDQGQWCEVVVALPSSHRATD
jgi:hypothetical protein